MGYITCNFCGKETEETDFFGNKNDECSWCNKKLISGVSFEKTIDIDEITHYNGKPYTGLGYRTNDDGKIDFEVNMVNGLKHGLGITYYSNGQIESVGNYKKDLLEGLFKQYYNIPEKKQLQQEGDYKKGKGNGLFTLYDELGNKIRETEIINGVKEGLSSSFDEKTGECFVKFTYKNNIIIKREDVGYTYKHGPFPIDFTGTLGKDGEKIYIKGIDDECYLDNEQISIYDYIKGTELFNLSPELVKEHLNIEHQYKSFNDLKDYYMWFYKSDEEKFKLLFNFKTWWRISEKEISRKIQIIIKEEIEDFKKEWDEKDVWENNLRNYKNWTVVVSSILSHNIGVMGHRVNELIDSVWCKSWDDEDETYIIFEEKFHQIFQKIYEEGKTLTNDEFGNEIECEE